MKVGQPDVMPLSDLNIRKIELGMSGLEFGKSLRGFGKLTPNSLSIIGMKTNLSFFELVGGWFSKLLNSSVFQLCGGTVQCKGVPSADCRTGWERGVRYGNDERRI